MRKTEKSYTAWYLLLFVILMYIISFLFFRDTFFQSTSLFLSIIQKIAPVFVLVLFITFLTNWLLKPRFVVRHLGKGKGLIGWLYAIIGGILSVGPIYMWYPLLNELQKKKVKNKYLVAFLYNRAIKLPLIPMFILYFNFKYILILTAFMIFASIIQGIVVDKMLEVWK